MTIPTLVIGDTFAHPGTFYAGDPSAAYDITGAQIKVAVVSPDHSIRYCSDILQGETNDFNPANGRILVQIPATVTQEIGDYITSQSSGLLELQVDDGTAKYTWFSEINLVRGHVA